MAKKKGSNKRRGKKDKPDNKSDPVKKDDAAPAITSSSTTKIDDSESAPPAAAPPAAAEATAVEQTVEGFDSLRDSLERVSSALANTPSNKLPDNQWNEKFKREEDDSAHKRQQQQQQQQQQTDIMAPAANKGETWSPMREVPRGSVSKYKEPLEAITKDMNNSLDVFYSCKDNAAPDSEAVGLAAPEEETEISEALEKSDNNAATATTEESASLKVEEEETTPKPKVDGSAKKEKKHKKSKGPTSTSTNEAENEVVGPRSTTSGTAAAATSAPEANETEVTNTDEETATKFRSVVTKLLKRACCVKSVRSSNNS